MNQQLSPQAQNALVALKALPQTELAQVVAIASTELATRIAYAASTSTPEQLAKASSRLVDGVQAARAQPLMDKLEAPLQTLPSAPVSPARAEFDAISVRVPINEKFFDVAVPNEMFDKSRSDQTAIAVKIGGEIGTRELNRAVANYLLDREAFDLLAKEEAGMITREEKALLKLHRAKWQEDKAAEDRAKAAGEITDKEAALLKVYRDRWVRDTAGGLAVVGVRVRDSARNYFVASPDLGALVVCPSAESKKFDL